MASPALPEPPAQLKAIAGFMRIASDIERIEPIVAYWVRLFSTESALKIDRESPECKAFLGTLIMWLENFKQTHKDNETVSNQTVGQAHMENFVVALFNKADTLDREGTANKNTIRMFYMAALLFEAMAVFGPLTEEVSKKAKYAKFKAAYIQKCLKTGQTPKPGPLEGEGIEDGTSGQQPSDEQSGTIPQPPATDAPPQPKEDSNSSTQPEPKEPFIMTPSQPPSVPPTLPQTKMPQPDSSSAGGTPYKAPPSSSSTTPAKVGGSTINATRFHATNGAPLNPEDILKGQKYCKFATSALQYDDIGTAVANLEKALKLLKTGQD